MTSDWVTRGYRAGFYWRSEEHTSELQSQSNLVCRLLLEKKKKTVTHPPPRSNHTHPQSAYSCLTGRPLFSSIISFLNSAPLFFTDLVLLDPTAPWLPRM